MSSTIAPVDVTLYDSTCSRTSLAIRRKPPPPPTLTQRPASASAHFSLPSQPPAQQITHPSHKASFSERYPDPDPTDPFAPLWVLRNRTSSALHTEGPPVLGQLFQQRDTDEFGFRQPDRRRSVSYLPTFLGASSLNVSEGIQPAYASDHGHGATARVHRTYSIDNDNNNATNEFGRSANGIFNFTSAARRQSVKPTPLSQVTVLTPSVSRSSVSPVIPTPKSPYLVHRPHTADSSGTESESDATRVGHFGLSEVEITPRVAAQPSFQHLYDYQPPHPQPHQQRSRTGSTNKLTRFLRPRKASQSDSNTNNVRASITDINRTRKASISPPVFSTVVWAGQGGEFVPIEDHPLQQKSISIITARPNTLNDPSPFPSPPGSQHMHSKQGFLPIALPEPPRPIFPSSVPTDPLNETSPPLSPLPPPVVTSRRSQTSHGHTDESHSASSFVHVPTTLSSPSLAQLVVPTGPGVSASITSSATMKIKRTSSRPISKLPSPVGPSPLANSTIIPTHLSGITGPAQAMIGEWDIPSLSSLSRAASLPIIAESGVRIAFGTLFAQQRVVVLFIRHFWCPLCQDYMTSVASLTRRLGPEAIIGPGFGEDTELNEKSGAGDDVKMTGPVKLVVIGNGSYTMIGKYKQIFGSGAMPLDVFTDPSLAVYAALGLGKDPASLLGHPHSRVHKRSKSTGISQARLDAEVLGGSAKSACSDAGVAGIKGGVRERSKSGGYVKHGLMGGIAMVFVRALKVGMPVWEKGGDLNQLGGEFVLGPGLVCTYAHRMQTTKDHAPFEDVLQAAGLRIPVSLSLTGRQQKHAENPDEKKPNSLRKPRPSISNTLSQTTKSRARGRTIDIVPIPAVQPHNALAMPTSASLPPTSKISQTHNGSVSLTRRRSQRRRRSAVRSSTGSGLKIVPPSTAPASAGPFVQLKLQQGECSPPPISATSIISTDQENSTSVATLPGKSIPSSDATVKTGSNWKDDRRRSLQKIKEKKNIRRGMSQSDERHASLSTIPLPLSTSTSMSASRPASRGRPQSRSLSPGKSLSAALSTSQNQLHKGIERSRSRPRHRSTSAVGRSSGAEKALQSDIGLLAMRGERNEWRRGYDDTNEEVVMHGREMRMNRFDLSRDHSARREARAMVNDEIVASASVEDGVETVSKTLVTR